MDADTSVKQLKDLVMDFCDSRDWAQFHSPKDLAIGISTEANELLALFRFKDDLQVSELLSGHYEDSQKVQDELADTLFFILRFAQMNNIDLSEALLS